MAAVFEFAGLDPEDPYLEGIILAVAGLFVITMVVWMWRAARGLKANVEGRLQSITSGRSNRASRLGLFALVFFMVLREGVETVLFLKAAALGSEASAASLAGAFIGLALAVVFAVFFIRGSVRIDLRRFFRYTSVALLVLGAKLLLGSAHEFAELGLFPVGNGFIEEMGEVTSGNVGAIITGVIIAVPVVLLLWETGSGLLRRRPSHATGGS